MKIARDCLGRKDSVNLFGFLFSALKGVVPTQAVGLENSRLKIVDSEWLSSSPEHHLQSC